MGNHDQSWRGWKGKNLEKLIPDIIKDEIAEIGLKWISGDTLERTSPEKLSRVLSQVQHNLVLRFGKYGEYGCHLPDADFVIYNPETAEIIAIVSSKVTLRERIAQTGYWKTKMSQDKVTCDVKVLFVTLDEDKTLQVRRPTKKGRAICEVDTDGAYALSEHQVEPSDKVKMFDQFMVDLRKLVQNAK